MNNFFSFIFVLNIFISIVFCMQRLAIFLSNKIQLTQRQNLLYSRSIFIFSISIFMISKVISSHFTWNWINASIQQFSPSSVIHSIGSVQTTIISNGYNYWQYFLFVPILLVGFLCYINQLYQLRKLVQSSLHRKKLKHINLIYSSTAQLPQSFTFLKSSYVILPLSLLENNETLKVVVKHELQHLRQRDGLFRHFLAIINIFCWWNPIYRIYTRWLLSIQEFACDEALITGKKLSAKSYSEVLLAIAKKVSKPSHFISLNIAAGIFGTNNNQYQLKRRINMLFKNSTKNHRHFVLGAIFTLTLANSIIAFAVNSTHDLNRLAQHKTAQLKMYLTKVTNNAKNENIIYKGIIIPPSSSRDTHELITSQTQTLLKVPHQKIAFKSAGSCEVPKLHLRGINLRVSISDDSGKTHQALVCLNATDASAPIPFSVVINATQTDFNFQIPESPSLIKFHY